MPERIVDDYRGCTLFQISRVPVKLHATFAYEKHRILMEGTLSIDRTEGSYRWGDEIQISFHSTLPLQFQKRAENLGYSRFQIQMSKDLGRLLILEACRVLLKKGWITREELGI